jgi:hypothetical protein
LKGSEPRILDPITLLREVMRAPRETRSSVLLFSRRDGGRGLRSYEHKAARVLRPQLPSGVMISTRGVSNTHNGPIFDGFRLVDCVDLPGPPWASGITGAVPFHIRHGTFEILYANCYGDVFFPGTD